MEYPLGASDAAGWDLAAEFVNMYLGTGGEFFEPGTATLAIDNEQGRAALQMMRDLTGYMAPEYVSWNADGLNAEYLSGNIAMAQQWGSLVGHRARRRARPRPRWSRTPASPASPTVGGGTIPAAALWWDGFAIAQNISDEDAAASFQAMMHAIRPEVATAHPDAATWLIRGYQPGPAAVGVIGTAQGGARPYPMVPWMGVLHEVLGTELADFIKGDEDADAALADIGGGLHTPPPSRPASSSSEPARGRPRAGPAPRAAARPLPRLRREGHPCRTAPSSPSWAPRSSR